MKGTESLSPRSTRLLLRDIAITLSTGPLSETLTVTKVESSRPNTSYNRKRPNVFFNELFITKDYRKLGLNLDTLDATSTEVGSTQPTPRCKTPVVDCATQTDPFDDAKLEPQQQENYKAPKITTQAESNKPVSWADLSSDSSLTPTSQPLKTFNVDIVELANAIKPVPLLLQEPPKRKPLTKRNVSRQLNPKTPTETRKLAVLKFYSLKKRFGFLTVQEDGSDIFLCEDDIVLSSQNLKQFKDAVAQMKAISVLCDVKSYDHKGVTKRKAVNLEVRITV